MRPPGSTINPYPHNRLKANFALVANDYNERTLLVHAITGGRAPVFQAIHRTMRFAFKDAEEVRAPSIPLQRLGLLVRRIKAYDVAPPL